MTSPRTPGRPRAGGGVPAEAVTAAIREAGGAVTGAARILRCSPGGLHMRLARHPEEWPADVPRVPSDHAGLTLAERLATTAAIREAGGRMTDASRRLGLPSYVVGMRVRAHPDLWPDEVPRPPRGGSRPRVSDAVIAAVMGSAPSVAAAAQLLGVSRQALHARLREQREPAQGDG